MPSRGFQKKTGFEAVAVAGEDVEVVCSAKLMVLIGIVELCLLWFEEVRCVKFVAMDFGICENVMVSLRRQNMSYFHRRSESIHDCCAHCIGR